MAFIYRSFRSLTKFQSHIRRVMTMKRPRPLRWTIIGMSISPRIAHCCNNNNNNNDNNIDNNNDDNNNDGDDDDFNRTTTMFIDCENETEIPPPPPEFPATISEIREMFIQTSNAAIALFQKTAEALVQAENDYSKVIYKLIAFYSASLENLVEGNLEKDEKIWDLIVNTRLEIKDANEKRKKLMLVFSSTEKLIKNLSEVAFMAGDEETSSSAYKVLCETREEVQDAAGESKTAEKLLSQAQVHSIETSAKLIEENPDDLKCKEIPKKKG